MGVLIVFGYGPGISHATAERFARGGYSLALVARNADRLADGVARLKANGIGATAYLSDATDPTMIRSTIAAIRQELGTVSAVLWTAFRSGAVTNVLATEPEDVEGAFDVGVKGLLACVQEVLEDLKSVQAPRSWSLTAPSVSTRPKPTGSRSYSTPTGSRSRTRRSRNLSGCSPSASAISTSTWEK